MCVYRKNQEQEPNTKPSPAQRLPSPTPLSKNNQEKKFIKISCRNSLKFTVACRRCTCRPAPGAPTALSTGHLGPDPPCPRHRQTDRRQGDAAAAPSLNREVKKLNKLKQQINNTDLLSPLPPGPVPPGPGRNAGPRAPAAGAGDVASQQQVGVPRQQWAGRGRCRGGSQEAWSAGCPPLSSFARHGPCPGGGLAGWTCRGRQSLQVRRAGWRQVPRGQVLLPGAMRSGDRAERHAGGWTEAAAGGQRDGRAGPGQLPSFGGVRRGAQRVASWR